MNLIDIAMSNEFGTNAFSKEEQKDVMSKLDEYNLNAVVEKFPYLFLLIEDPLESTALSIAKKYPSIYKKSRCFLSNDKKYVEANKEADKHNIGDYYIWDSYTQSGVADFFDFNFKKIR